MLGRISSLRVNSYAARFIECEHVVGLGGTLHSGRARRHAGNREAANGRLLFQDAENQVCRHMTLDDISLNDGRMTGLKFLRNTIFALYCRELSIAHIFLFYLKTA